MHVIAFKITLNTRTKTRTFIKNQDQNKDFGSKEQDKDKDFTIKDKDQNKDCNFVLKDSLRTRTRTNNTAQQLLSFVSL